MRLIHQPRKTETRFLFPVIQQEWFEPSGFIQEKRRKGEAAQPTKTFTSNQKVIIAILMRLSFHLAFQPFLRLICYLWGCRKVGSRTEIQLSKNSVRLPRPLSPAAAIIET